MVRAGLALALLLLAGCASADPADSGPADAGSAGPASPSVSASGQGGTTPMGFSNPVYDSSFADPEVVAAGDGFFAYATNGPLGNIQTLRSTDLVEWEQVGDALPELPDWTSAGKVWAPEVTVHAPNRFVMYYTTSHDASSRQCIGVAVATKPEGPYVDTSTKPLICQENEGGSIDASPFVDAKGERYLYWKNDGNAVDQDTWIYASKLSADGLKLVGKPVRLFKQDLPWEGNLVEAPFMVERNGKFHLFYSANAYDKGEYAVGHALCTTPMGPCKKSGDPILKSSADAVGPGHNMVLRKDGRDWFVYHAWDPEFVGQDPPGRTMWLSELTWSGDTPKVQPPLKNNPSRP